MWQICLITGIIFLIMEIFIPAYFFLNLSIAAFICALIPLVVNISPYLLVTIYCFLSMCLILVLRPILTKTSNDKKLQTGMEAKYIGKTATAVEEINKSKGVISIYDERWQARNICDETIEKGSTVEIVSYEGLIMNVKKIN